MKKITMFLIFMLFLLGSQCLANTYGIDMALSNENIKAYLNKDVAIYCDGNYLEFYTSSKDRVYPITYNDSTYLPIRAISSLYNVPILWSGLENAIYLNDLGQVDTNAIEKVESFEKNGLYNIEAIKNKRISILYDSKRVSLYDVNGVLIYPLSYNDTTYLPVRAIANLFGCFVDYDGETNTVLLSVTSDGYNNISGDLYKSGDDVLIDDYSWIDIVDYRTIFERELIKDFYNNHSGDELKRIDKFLEERIYGDSTQIEYLDTNINWGKPQSGDFKYDFAIMNDSLCWSVLLYKEDPVTGRNIYEDKAEQVYDQIIEEADGDELLQNLLIQYYNLQYCLPSYYEQTDEDYYFGIDDIFIVNGDASGDYKAKEIEICINDDYKKIFELDEKDPINVLDVDYKQYSVLKCVEIKVNILSTFSGDELVCFTDFYPYEYSNIPQGR